ncbi:MAG: tetratricopeptide repeat protein [Thermoguttaceae bacterium]|jgi:tetratricopeptide (TPR) repeat protein
MKKSKRADERNSLEQLLLRWKRKYDENRTKTLQVVLVFLLVVVVVLLFRSGIFGGADKNDVADNAYFAATQSSFAGVSAPDADAFAAVASSYENTPTGALLHINAGEAFVRRGLADVTRKQRYSAGTKLEEGEMLGDPAQSYSAAIEEFEKALSSSSDADVKARALYGQGVAHESLASVADNDQSVVEALNAAKACYEKVLEVSPQSPYVPLAKEYLGRLDSEHTVEYYKATAHAFVTLPDPAETPSITSGDDSLEAGSMFDLGEEFDLQDDDEASSAEETLTGEEEGGLTSEEEESAAPAEETADAEETSAE